MTAVHHEPPHLLVITLDREWLAERHAAGDDVDETDRELWSWSIRCPYDGRDFSRPCVTYHECCLLTDEQHDDLSNDGDGPCPISPTGSHELSQSYGLSGPVRPGTECWLTQDEGLLEYVDDLITSDGLAPGEHPVHATIGYEYTELTLVYPTGLAAEDVPS